MKQMSLFDSFLRKNKTANKETTSEVKKMQEASTIEKNTAEKNQADNHNQQNNPSKVVFNKYEEEREN